MKYLPEHLFIVGQIIYITLVLTISSSYLIVENILIVATVPFLLIWLLYIVARYWRGIRFKTKTVVFHFIISFTLLLIGTILPALIYWQIETPSVCLSIQETLEEQVLIWINNKANLLITLTFCLFLIVQFFWLILFYWKGPNILKQ